MLVKVEDVRDGPGPAEKVATINGVDRREQVIVSSLSLKGDALEVGLVAMNGTKYLVELPRESMNGNWRVWVPKDDVRELAPA